MSKFEPYVRESRRAYGEPGASISRVGLLSFNASAKERHIKDNAWVDLFFDREARLIGLRLSAEKRPESFKIQPRPHRMSVVYLKGFLEHYGIPHDKTYRYPLSRDDKNRMLLIDLKAPK